MRRFAANVGHTAGQIALAAAVAVLVTVVSLVAISRVDWPAYNSSNQLHALTTVGQFGCLLALFAAGWLWRRASAGESEATRESDPAGWGYRPLAGESEATRGSDPPTRGRYRLLARAVALVFLSAFSVVTLAMPLGATKLYLFGISVDQQFRTEYLTRLTDTAAPHDMTYADLPPFYPPGWFWIGGRAAALTGTPAWEMFKPWAITSITVAIAVAFVLWTAMVRFEYALIVSTATAAATLAYAPTEPYAAVIAVLLPAVMVLAWSGLRGATRSGGWAAVVGVGLFLGFAATFYTLLLLYSAFTLTLMAAVLAVSRRKWDPVRRLAVILAIAGAIALVGWLPYLLAAVRGSPAKSGTAQHYLPADGAVLSFPMLQFTLLGALCMLGALWLVIRARTSTRAGGLAISVLAVYVWSLLSMLTTLVGTTLLSFRLQPTLTVLLTAAGAFGFIETARAVAARYQPTVGTRIVTAAGAVGLIGALMFSQDIPDVLRPDIIVAYTDTDGAGQRADLRPPGAEKYYREIDTAITRATGRPRNETVVLTADYSFLSYYPYFGFQGLTSHYANPLAQFDARAAAIGSWSKLSTSAQFVAALDALPWKPPTVFLMREGASGSYTLRLASDVYPNQPNVKRYQVALDAALFHGPQFTVTTIGPFVLAIRTPVKAG